MIPDYFKPLFWDVDIKSLDLKKHRRYIIERTLNMGDLEHLRWIIKNYSKYEILEEVKNNPHINKKSAVLIANLFEVPKEEFICLKHV